MKEVLCVRGGLRGPLRHLVDKLGQLFRRFIEKKEQYSATLEEPKKEVRNTKCLGTGYITLL